MTWVIGGSTVFGYGALISDIRVTFSDGSEADLIQKAYPISNFVAAGFAGSVQMGFLLLNDLSEFTKLAPEALKTHAWEPSWIADKWPIRAKTVFQTASHGRKEVVAQFLIVCASPNEGTVLDAKIAFIKLDSRTDFIPEIFDSPNNLCSIGSGTDIPGYMNALRPAFDLKSGFFQAEVGNEGGWGQLFGFSVTRAINSNPVNGISNHLHGHIVKRGGIYQFNNDEKIHKPDGTVVEIKMPTVAQNYSEFLKMASSYSSEVEGAVC